ncbi:MAG: hypothetical protein AB7P33_02885 [Dehalococcoidia bacterium]
MEHSEPAANNLYYCRIKVSRSPDSSIPEIYKGAYVGAFAAAADHQKALGLIIPGLLELGWQFEELVQNRVDEMNPEHWQAFVEASFPDLAGSMPDSAEIEQLLVTGGAFYGPFSVWTEPGSGGA